MEYFRSTNAVVCKREHEQITHHKAFGDSPLASPLCWLIPGQSAE